MMLILFIVPVVIIGSQICIASHHSFVGPKPHKECPIQSCTHGVMTAFPTYNYSPDFRGWLKVHTRPVSWLEAIANCRSEGGEIASPITVARAEALKYEMTKHNIPCGIFTDIHDTYTPGTFYTIIGTALSYYNHFSWKRTKDCQIDNDSKKVLVMDADGLLSAVDSVVTSKNSVVAAYPYICFKWKHDSSDDRCGTDPEYKYINHTGSCYKFHEEGKTWPQAAAICASEDAHLAVINCPEEAQALKGLFTQHPKEKLQSQFKDSALIGFKNWGPSLGWLTMFGEKLEKAGYSTWSPGQPDHSRHPNGNDVSSTPFCGAIFRTAQLDDIWCDVNFAFICEKESNNDDNHCALPPPNDLPKRTP